MAAKLSTLTNTRNEDYDQTINGKRYLIKAGETVTLNRYEAVDVKGFYVGYNKPVCLKIVHLPDAEDVPIGNLTAAPSNTKIYCAPDGKEFANQADCLDYAAAMNKKQKA